MVNTTEVIGAKVKKLFKNCSFVRTTETSAKKVRRFSLWRVVFITLLFSPVLAQALGLGPLTTNSSLNESFDGEIKLLNSTAEELKTLTVVLGSIEQFKDAGIERPFLLSALKFEVVNNKSGRYLHITSEEVIKEPYLNFLLEVNWAKGRLIREYTALLDPPVFDTKTRVVDTTETAVSEPAVEQKTSITRTTPAPIESREVPQRFIAKTETDPESKVIEEIEATAETDPEPIVLNEFELAETEPAITTPKLGQVPNETRIVDDENLEFESTRKSTVEPEESEYETFTEEELVSEVEDETTTINEEPYSSGLSSHTTKKGDTLWNIASQNRPDRSVSIQQMMMALLNSNPNAFVDNNINVLKTGQVLRIPEHSEITQLTKSEAIALVKEHNQLWDDYRQGLASSVATRPVGAVSSVGTVVEDEPEYEEFEEPELRLVTPTDETSSGEGNGSGTEIPIAKTLEDELALANEQLVSGKSEALELKDRLRENQEISELLDQQIDLKNQELSALQQRLREGSVAESEDELDTEEELALKDDLSEAEQELALKDDLSEAEQNEEIKIEDSATDDSEEKETIYLEEDPLTALDDDNEVTDPLNEPKEEAGEEGATEEESIDDILAALEGDSSSADAIYLEEDEGYNSEDNESTYSEYDKPAEDLSGDDSKESQYYDNGDESNPAAPEEDQIESDIDEEAIDETEESSSFLGKVSSFVEGLIPVSLLEKIPGGVKTILGVGLATLLLIFAGVFRIFKGGKDQDNAETIDLLDPTELEKAEQATEQFTEEVEQDFEEDIEEAGKVDEAETSVDEVNDDVDLEVVVGTKDTAGLDDAIEYDLDFDEELPSSEEEFTTEGLTNLEDTLEQIKPLLEQTDDEDFDEDPLEEVNLSLAYEQFDKAEELVKKAIEEHPNEDGYKLRLLEVHYAANNMSAYEETAKTLFDVTNGEGHLWDSAEAMWSEMSPKRRLFEDAEMDLNSGAVDMIDSESSVELDQNNLSDIDVQEIDLSLDDSDSEIVPENQTLSLDENEVKDLADAGVFDLDDANIPTSIDKSSLEEAGKEEMSLSTGDFMNFTSDESLKLDSDQIAEAEMIDITDGDNLDKTFDNEDFLNIGEAIPEDIKMPEMDLSEELGEIDLNKTVPATDEENLFSNTNIEDELSETMGSLSSNMTLDDEPEIDFSSLNLDEDEVLADSEATSIDMLDITAVSNREEGVLPNENDTLSSLDSDAEELFELSNDFKSVDDTTLTATSLDESKEQGDILNLSSEDLSNAETIASTSHLANTDLDDTEVLSLTADDNLSLTGDEDLESLAKSLEETISGFDNSDLDELTFEFDPDGTLASTLAGTLAASSDLDLDNEGDEIDTKLNLAKAYIELGDSEGARDILQEVSVAGSDNQKKEAYELLQQIS